MNPAFYELQRSVQFCVIHVYRVSVTVLNCIKVYFACDKDVTCLDIFAGNHFFYYFIFFIIIFLSYILYNLGLFKHFASDRFLKCYASDCNLLCALYSSLRK